MVAYICSGLESGIRRECVSIRELCHKLYPDASVIDPIETKMLRLLRLKKVNRFRPQCLQKTDLTRLIDVKDAELHWDYIKQEMNGTSISK
jgi:hypothetical protein